MDIAQVLQEKHSKENALKLSAYIINNSNKLPELLGFLFDNDIRICQKAAWPISMIGKENPTLFLPYFEQMICGIQNPIHDAVSRNIYRVFQDLDIPEVYEGDVFDQCIKDIEDPKKPVAIKAFAMTVAYNISKNHLEIQRELAIIIEANAEGQTAAYASRAKKILKALAKQSKA